MCDVEIRFVIVLNMVVFLCLFFHMIFLWLALIVVGFGSVSNGLYVKRGLQFLCLRLPLSRNTSLPTNFYDYPNGFLFCLVLLSLCLSSFCSSCNITKVMYVKNASNGERFYLPASYLLNPRTTKQYFDAWSNALGDSGTGIAGSDRTDCCLLRLL